MGMIRNDRLGKVEFRKLRQRPEETLREFHRRVRNIGTIAYSEKDPNTRDEFFRQKFLEGLSEVQLEVQLLKENPQTIGDLVNRAVDLKVIARKTRGRSRNEQERYEEFGRQQDSSREFRGHSPERTVERGGTPAHKKKGPDDADDDVCGNNEAREAVWVDGPMEKRCHPSSERAEVPGGRLSCSQNMPRLRGFWIFSLSMPQTAREGRRRFSDAWEVDKRESCTNG